jgi:cellulose biosynthesis protein BcsQ
MKAVAARLAALHARCGYRVIIIYVDPQHSEILEETFKFVASGKSADVLVLTTDKDIASDAIAAP